MFRIVEPQRGVNLLQSLFAWMQASIFRSYRIPILADAFMFTYPVYLLALYIYGITQLLKRGNIEQWKHGIQYKIAALYIFAGTMVSFLASFCFQWFVDKVRPHLVLGLIDLKKETLLHQFLPAGSFPSDHATVSMGIAMMSLLRGVKNKDRKFLRFGGILIIFSLITSFARITSGVHRPTDIIAGSVIGIIIPLFLVRKPIYRFGTGVAEKIAKVI